MDIRKEIRLHSFLGLLAVCLVCSCEKNEFGVPSGCTNQTGWLKTGHQWVYEFHSPFIYADTLVINVDDEIRPNVFEVSTVADDTALYTVGTKYIQPCGNDIYISSLSSMEISFLSYKADGNVGEKWQYTMPTSKGYTATISSEITEKNVPVTVAAGTFPCLHILEDLTSTDTSAMHITTDYYLNNDYGLIKVVNTLQEYSLVRKNY